MIVVCRSVRGIRERCPRGELKERRGRSRKPEAGWPRKRGAMDRALRINASFRGGEPSARTAVRRYNRTDDSMDAITTKQL